MICLFQFTSALSAVSFCCVMYWTLKHWTLMQELVHSDAVQALAGGTISAQACIESKFFEIAVV